MAKPKPMPKEFLDWQVRLRHHTMHERNGAPHIGVVPLVTVQRRGVGIGVVSHSVVCGLLPHPRLLDGKTHEFRELYESKIGEGAKAVYDVGIEYLLDYYTGTDDFDPDTITTLLPEKGDLVDALRANARCSLVFNVFDGLDKSDVGGVRCTQINAIAEIHADGPVYENVWWHNTLFHGKADGHVVIRFRHETSWDTRFGGLQELAS